MWKVLRKTLDMAVAAIVCFMVFPLAAGLLGFRTYCVQSGSMEPVLKTGSMIFARKPEDIRVGDIVTFQKWDVPVTHRVVKIQNDMYFTKGDANERADQGSVQRRELLGKIAELPGGGYCVPYIGYIQTIFLKWKWGIAGLLTCYILLRKERGNYYEE